MLVRLSIAAAFICALVTATPALAADPAGAWIFSCETPSGVRTMKADFKVDGDKITGTWDNAPVQGSIADGKLDLSFPYTPHETNSQGTLQLKGQLERRHDRRHMGVRHLQRQLQGVASASRGRERWLEDHR